MGHAWSGQLRHSQAFNKFKVSGSHDFVWFKTGALHDGNILNYFGKNMASLVAAASLRVSEMLGRPLNFTTVSQETSGGRPNRR